MEIIRERQSMKDLSKAFLWQKKTVGFVPTMGAFHEGHLSLIKRAKKENDVVVVSVFVNPTQFGSDEDFQKYPSNFDRDSRMIQELCDVLFYPSIDEMYFSDEKVLFSLKDLSLCLCGISRPGHFEGVCQVVAKLLHIVRPTKLYLGQKDYQQATILRHLVREFFFDLELILCPTLRDQDGLAMSSRNIFLTPTERASAPLLFQSLQLALGFLQAGEVKPDLIIQRMHAFLEENNGGLIDYVDIRDAFTLEKVVVIQKPVVVALAVFFSHTRLIDNILFDPHET